jgi:hypothetical protein
MQTHISKTNIGKTATRQITQQKRVSQKDVRQHLTKRKQEIIRKLDLQLQNPFITKEKRKHIQELKRLVTRAETPVHWYTAVSYAALVGLVQATFFNLERAGFMETGASAPQATMLAASVTLGQIGLGIGVIAYTKHKFEKEEKRKKQLRELARLAKQSR